MYISVRNYISFMLFFRVNIDEVSMKKLVFPPCIDFSCTSMTGMHILVKIRQRVVSIYMLSSVHSCYRNNPLSGKFKRTVKLSQKLHRCKIDILNCTNTYQDSFLMCESRLQ